MRTLIILAAILSLAWSADPFDTKAVAKAEAASGKYSPDHIKALVAAWKGAGIKAVEVPAPTNKSTQEERERAHAAEWLNGQVRGMNANFGRWILPENISSPAAAAGVDAEVRQMRKAIKAAEDEGIVVMPNWKPEGKQ
jgi:hypothetical protein